MPVAIPAQEWSVRSIACVHGRMPGDDERGAEGRDGHEQGHVPQVAQAGVDT